MPIVNDMNQETLSSFRDTVEADSNKADRWPTVVAHWDGKAASRIEFEDKEAHIGGRGAEPDAIRIGRTRCLRC
jgi:hypothetical protein